MRSRKYYPTIILAFFTATASSVYIIENLLLRALPVPFLRLGLSNVIVLYLLMKQNYLQAIFVNILKSFIGGIATFTLLTPSSLLSVTGGFSAILLMILAQRSKLGFSIIGISICGAIGHNLAQIGLVRILLIKSDSVFDVLPMLMLLGLISGIIIAYLYTLFIKLEPSFDHYGTLYE